MDAHPSLHPADFARLSGKTAYASLNKLLTTHLITRRSAVMKLSAGILTAQNRLNRRRWSGIGRSASATEKNGSCLLLALS